VLERPSISSTVGDEGVRQPVKWRVRRRVSPREPGKLWLALSCIDSRGYYPFVSLSIKKSRFDRVEQFMWGWRLFWVLFECWHLA